MVSKEDIKKVLANHELQEIEDEIAINMCCTIYDNPMFIEIERQNIEDSQLPIDKIENYFSLNRKHIVDFSIILLSQNGPTKSFARGASISYCIYCIYVYGQPEKLLDYLKKRRISKASKVAMELMSIKRILDERGCVVVR